MPRGRLRAALVLFSLWRRLPTEHRRAMLRLGRRHGLRLALTAFALWRRGRAARP